MVSSSVAFVPQGSIGQIIAYMVDKNFDLYEKTDKYLLAMIGKPQSGWVSIKDRVLTRGDFLYKLSHSKAPLKVVTYIPGETKELFMVQLALDFDLSYEKLLQEYTQATPYIDGFLVPDTYYIPIGMNEKDMIHFLVLHAKKYHQEVFEKIFGEFNEAKWYKFITIASIIQKEAANNDEMPIVSSVIYNRLKKDMKLQMDGTLNYGQYSHVKVTAQRIKEDTSVYNTYLHKGLPPYPICAVSKEAIIAAIFPKNTNYLYFVKNKSGEHTFSQNYETHLQNIKN
ncbi:MAG: endolytic transglycosylase MltG [Sulfurospirillaceae bacterium]|nr:endolytic transglycosylase MltG [Sulfurospirillaceae bacterium]MDD2826278.1 endolytic transglycosylase MltG [Sulfurospirillaceae bacterium]